MSEEDDDSAAPNDNDAIVAEAKRRFKRCVDWESDWRQHARDDKRFANGDAYNRWQWDETVLTTRADRPCLTNNKTRQHLLQIANDQRQHKTEIRVNPTGGDATYEAGKVFSACIRRIEAQSKALDAYSTAGYDQIEIGMGYCRIVTEYVSEDSFDQDLFIRREPDPLSIYLDPDAKDYDKADMRFAFKFRDMARDEFKAEYGALDDVGTAPLDNRDEWDTKDHVRVAEYFRRLDRRDELHLMKDGSVVRNSDQEDGWKADNKANIERSRDVARYEVEWFLIGGTKILERKEWPSRYIPIVPWIGEEIIVDGQMDRRGHTRALLDPQRMYNYATSAAAEFVGLQTKTPYIAAAEAIEGNEEDWFNANKINKSVLVFNAWGEAGQQIPRPEREKPPVAAPAYLELMNTAKQEMMMVSGQYQENFGQPSNAQSGVAIQNRQREGDNATYHYIDNHAKGVRQCGRILLDMIPRIYDVQRVIKIMAEDGTQSDVTVDPNLPAAHVHTIPGLDGKPQQIDADQAKQHDNDPSAPDVTLIFNPTVGTYDVEADVGPAFATQRQEAVNAMTQIIQAAPKVMDVAGDLLAKSYDWPGADELAERLKRMIPPQALGGPSPEIAQLQQQMAQMKQEAEHRIVMLQTQINDQGTKLSNQSQDKELDEFKAQTDRLKVVATMDPDTAKLMVRQMYEQAIGGSLVPLLVHGASVDAAVQQIAQPQADGPPQGPPGGPPVMAAAAADEPNGGQSS